MSTQTITEFLEARIADDEMHARMMAVIIPEEPAPFSSTRILHECAVKRAIIANWGPHEALDGPNLLAVMAAVYSTHPDYRGPWAA